MNSAFITTPQHIEYAKNLSAKQAVVCIATAGRQVPRGQLAIYEASKVDASNHHHWKIGRSNIQMETWLKIFEGLHNLGIKFTLGSSKRQRYTITINKKD